MTPAFSSAIRMLASTPTAVFMGSTLLLLGGLGIKVWERAVRWSFLNAMHLSEIERRQPHLPSGLIIAFIFLCNTQLLMLASYAANGVPILRHAQYGWLYIDAVFVMSAAAWALAEMKSQRAAEYGLACNVGTTIAFFFLLLESSLVGSAAMVGLFVALVVLVGLALWFGTSGLLARSPRLVLLATVSVWLLLSCLP